MTPYAHNAIREQLGRIVAGQKRSEIGAGALAGAIYGSVAHGAAQAYSDVELVLIVDDALPYSEEKRFTDGILIEITCVPQSRMLRAATQVQDNWGIQADQYRHHLVLWDDAGCFAQVHTAAYSVTSDQFAEALAHGWWLCYEIYGKALNAIAEEDRPRACYIAWEFAYLAAMRVALYQQIPYESGRTLWTDVAARGFGFPDLLAALTDGNWQALPAALTAIWRATGTWGAPAADEQL